MSYPCAEHIPPGSLLCSPAHCVAFSESTSWMAYCRCIDWQGKHIPNCEPKDPKTPIITQTCYNKVTKEQRNISADACQDLRDRDRNWGWHTCYCCCARGGYDSEIKTSKDEVKPAQDIDVSDTVQSASIEMLDGKLSVTWRAAEVSFSDGLAAGEEGHEVIIIRYGEGREVRATPDRLFLMSDGRLKAANLLQTGDELVSDTGSPVKIESIKTVNYHGSIHHLGLGAVPPDTDVPVNGHLLSTGGIICGDYWLQVMRDSNEVAPPLLAKHDDMTATGIEA